MEGREVEVGSGIPVSEGHSLDMSICVKVGGDKCSDVWWVHLGASRLIGAFLTCNEYSTCRSDIVRRYHFISHLTRCGVNSDRSPHVQRSTVATAESKVETLEWLS